MEFQQSVGTRNLCIRNKSFLIRETPSLVLNFYLFSKTATNGLKSAFFYFWKNFYSKKLLSHIDITRVWVSSDSEWETGRSCNACFCKRSYKRIRNFYRKHVSGSRENQIVKFKSIPIIFGMLLNTHVETFDRIF